MKNIIALTIALAATTAFAEVDRTLYPVTPENIKAERKAEIEALKLDDMTPEERLPIYKELVGDTRYSLCMSINNNTLGDDFALMGCILVPYVHGTEQAKMIFGY